ARCGQGVLRSGSAWQKFRATRCRRDLLAIDQRDANGFLWTRLGARRSFAHSEAIGAQIAFPDDAAARRIFGDVVRTFHDAILAADALVIEMSHDAGERILVVRQHRTTVQAARISAMMACRGHGLLKRLPPVAAEQESDVAPRFAVVQSVQT